MLIELRRGEVLRNSETGGEYDLATYLYMLHVIFGPRAHCGGSR